MKWCFSFLIIFIFSLSLIFYSNNNIDVVKAASSNGTSDLQLIARAINRRSKRRIL